MRELSLHILDILQNAVEAGATSVELTIDEDLPGDWMTFSVRDNGRGIPPERLPHLFDPFYTTRKTRHVGLGLPLLKAAAERCSGDASITSGVGAGTTLTATFQHSHLDRAPLGDIAATLMSFVLGSTCELRYAHRVVRRVGEWRSAGATAEEQRPFDRLRGRGPSAGSGAEEREFAFDTAAIRAELGDVPLTHPDVRGWLRQFIVEGESTLIRPMA